MMQIIFIVVGGVIITLLLLKITQQLFGENAHSSEPKLLEEKLSFMQNGVIKFRDELRKYGDVKILYRPNARTGHLIEFAIPSGPVVIYIKESNSNQGFWGLTKNQIEAFDEHTKWFVVLLLRSHDSGYVLSSDEVLSGIETGAFELGNPEDYKVHEKQDLENSRKFDSIAKLVDWLYLGQS